jgi:hypothetical protein|tara:strand:- start:1504 stop:2145 length:642 start_codon:yes stop_codon:yes gene_type:complete
MKSYKKIPIWENSRRLNKLYNFRGLIIEYFNNSRLEWMADERIEENDAREARVAINRSMDEVHAIILYSGISPSLIWTPPPAVGGYRQNIDLIQNVFNLHAFRIEPNNILDFIDRSIGVYESNRVPSIFRALNPFFYAGLLFDALVDIPFVFIGKLGVNKEKAESSVIGKTVKGALYLITVAAAFLTILQLLDLIGPVKQFISELIGSSKRAS